MKIGIIIYSNEPETVWNAFRFGVFAIKQGNEVQIFLTGRGVDAEDIDGEQFNVSAMVQEFAGIGGAVLACGTCLKLHSKREPKFYSVGNMQAMLNIIGESDKVLTF